jgi:hypothetical protein
MQKFALTSAATSPLCLQGKWNMKWAEEAAKWGADFMAKSTEESRVLLHIGDIRADHNYLGRAEMYPDMNRNILFCDTGAFLSSARQLVRFSILPC